MRLVGDVGEVKDRVVGRQIDVIDLPDVERLHGQARMRRQPVTEPHVEHDVELLRAGPLQDVVGVLEVRREDRGRQAELEVRVLFRQLLHRLDRRRRFFEPAFHVPHLIMELIPLTAISPIDGRYRKHVQHLDEYFSEYALIKYRVLVEIEYFFFLEDKKFFKLAHKASKHLKKLQEDFGLEDAQEIKQIEYTTNHDVKAVEYFLKSELEKSGGAQIKEWIHFGLTSQDINNTAIPLLWKHAIEYEYLPSLLNLNAQLKLLVKEWKDIPMDGVRQ